MDSSPYRFRVATRIHYGLLKHIGEGIDLPTMLEREDYALDVLQVCRASGNAELQHLAEAFVAASRQRPGRAPHAPSLSADTSGFGLTEPPLDTGAASAVPSERARLGGWFGPIDLFGLRRPHR
ncbi:hypothetical protein M8A51_03085 [Schlegelella sp. S2-27]|uniref:Uncharacterized protein n=1 Tax=Caldimonas mangrovi TaxID=2944811 RepID=A0ABT0YJT8_9BURK|nr:hypothetical protein [Caldimonas mangrovi]MCM5678512.1 hypothetical protein [Caldimonas mangrovi]